MVTEKIAILNDPLPQEVAIALEHGFRILQPKDIVDSKVSSNIVIIIVSIHVSMMMFCSFFLCIRCPSRMCGQ